MAGKQLHPLVLLVQGLMGMVYMEALLIQVIHFHFSEVIHPPIREQSMILPIILIYYTGHLIQVILFWAQELAQG